MKQRRKERPPSPSGITRNEKGRHSFSGGKREKRFFMSTQGLSRRGEEKRNHLPPREKEGRFPTIGERKD